MKQHLTLALLGTLAVAPCAFAQDNGTTSASGKHVAIVAGAALNNPTGDADVGGARTNLDGQAVGTLGASWFINDNVAIEGWGASKAGYRMTTSAGKVGSVDAQPYALSGQYHFARPTRRCARSWAWATTR